MNNEIRSMIDEQFSEMKMTAENLALRDELLANAQARYEDAMAQGKSEEEALDEVAASLEDVRELLEQEADTDGVDLGDALNKAITALGDFSQAIMPEAKKLYGQMDEATGGMLGKIGRAAKKGMKDAKRAAGEAIDRLSKESGELVFDFNAKREEKPEDEFVSDFGDVTQPAPQEKKETDGALDIMDFMPAEEQKPDYVTPEGDIDEAALAREVDDLAREAQEAIRQAEQMPDERA